MNRIIIKGRLTRDPEMKAGGTGTEYCKFTVAVDRQKKEDPADFFECTAFGKRAAFITQYITKGREILIEGRMQSSTYEKDGQKRKSWTVIVDNCEPCGSKQDSAGAPAAVDAQSGMQIAEGEELPF